jgi:3-isopropylmalate/(R)-2-methylmalate dehydratase small subunit
MRPFEHIKAVAMPMPVADVNTDQIVPGRFMHKLREDYGRYCFHDLRFDSEGTPRHDFVLNQPIYAHAAILVAGANFGCGSSREHAVFTLADFGFRAILAPSFGDIFFINCFKNGVLPIVLPEDVIAGVLSQIERSPGVMMSIDLPSQQVSAPDGTQAVFEINGFYKECLLKGLDEIELTLSMRADIDKFEAAYSIHPINDELRK